MFDSLKSTFGYIFSLVVGAMSWKSIKQTITASSMMEVKLIAHHQAMSQAIWLRNFISSLKIVNSISKPIKINCDNLWLFSSLKTTSALVCQNILS